MKIAAVQMVSTPDVDRNLAAALRLIAQAADGGAALVALPEYFCLMGHHDRDKLAIAERPGHGPLQAALADAARRHGVWLIGGTLPLAVERGGDGDGVADAAGPGTGKGAGAGVETPTVERVHNASCVWGPDGALHARYDKIHLFRYDNGRERYDEGRVLQPGATPVAVQTGPVRTGLSICYDLRFPELYRALMRPPCDLLAVPAAFTHTTGEKHWSLLLRARAVENQCYVIAPAQGGLHENGRHTWGHSMVVDPWGEVLAELPQGEGMVSAELDLQRLAEVRTQLPALTHRVLGWGTDARQ